MGRGTGRHVEVGQLGQRWVFDGSLLGDGTSTTGVLERIGMARAIDRAVSSTGASCRLGVVADWSGRLVGDRVLVETPGDGVTILEAADLELLGAIADGVAGDGFAAAVGLDGGECTRRITALVGAGLVTAATTGPAAGPPQIRPHRQALRDPVLDEALREDGWVKLRLVDAGQAAALRAAFGELHGWSGVGFDVDPDNPDPAYRRRTSEALRDALGPIFDDIFVDHVPFMQGFYCKWPDTPETDIHCDWTSVDERSGSRSYIAWMALQDIPLDAGPMSVLPGSHRVDRVPRGSNLNLPLSEAWATHEPRIWDRLVRVDLRAGEALIFDMGLLHASFPNSSPQPRVGAVTCIRPREEPVCYYRRASDRYALRYEVDEEFFFEMTPSQLVGDVPDRFPLEVVDLQRESSPNASVQVSHHLRPSFGRVLRRLASRGAS